MEGRICESRRGGWLTRRSLASSTTAVLAVTLFALCLAQVAWGDSGDVKIPPQKPLPTAIPKFEPKTGHVAVELIGAWSWPTHGNNCNENRAGTGVAVDWFDPKQAGNPLGASVTVEGKLTPILVGVESSPAGSLNPVDNVVHPTENDTGSGAVVDVSTPSEFSKWRGGCGVFTIDKFFKNSEAAKKGELTEGLVAHGNFGHVAPGAIDFNKNPFTNPTPPATETLQGARLVHTYNSPEEITHICAVTYDVHSGTNASKNNGVGIPGGEGEIIAGGNHHNGDNGVQQNSGTPTGNACVSVELFHTKLATETGGPFTAGGLVKDEAALSGGTAGAKGTLTFHLFADDGKGGCAAEIGSSEVEVTKGANGVKYPSGGVKVATAGTYHWVAEYSGDTSNLPSKTVCGEPGENPKVLSASIEVKKLPALQTITQGGTAKFEIVVKNTGETDLEKVRVKDIATAACGKEVENAKGEKGILKKGESASYTCKTTALENPFTNVAEACGVSQGVEVCSTGEAEVKVLTPKIAIEKLPSSQSITEGGTAKFKIKVTNSGEVDLENVKVTDAQAPGCEKTFPVLKKGTTEEYECSLTGVKASFTNHAKACGSSEGIEKCAEAEAEVKVLKLKIEVKKLPAAQTITEGATAKFKIKVVNNGDVDLENVKVTDAQAPGCEKTIGTLKKGATEEYECQLKGVKAAFTNHAKACGTSEGIEKCGEGEAEVKVLKPHISVEKPPATQSITQGANAKFTVTVKNDGEVDLVSVIVKDPKTPSCEFTMATLKKGEAKTHECTAEKVKEGFTNVAKACGGSESVEVCGEGEAKVKVLVPKIEVQKLPASQSITEGANATFKLKVTNSGEVDLENVKVTDPQTGECEKTFPLLKKGASEEYECTAKAVKTSFTNHAKACGTSEKIETCGEGEAEVKVLKPKITVEKLPASQSITEGADAKFKIKVTNSGEVDLENVKVTDPKTGECEKTFALLKKGATEEYECTAKAVKTTFTNVAKACGTSEKIEVCGEGEAEVKVLKPSIELKKEPASQSITEGATAKFKIKVTNMGQVDLENVKVTDAMAPGCEKTFALLKKGASESYECSVKAVKTPFTNHAKACGTSEKIEVCGEGEAAVKVLKPHITVEKNPATQSITKGANAKFKVKVTNDGEVDLEGVMVKDPKTPSCEFMVILLKKGESQTHECTAEKLTEDLTNIAKACGTSEGVEVCGEGEAKVKVLTPKIEVKKTPKSQSRTEGAVATFEIEVTNTGEVDLEKVAVKDVATAACGKEVEVKGNEKGLLKKGESTKYTCKTGPLENSFINVAVACGVSEGVEVCSEGEANVEVLKPKIEIQKLPASQSITEGATAKFKIKVTNSGEVDLENVKVTDPLAPKCEKTIGLLKKGASEEYECSLADVTKAFTNHAKACGLSEEIEKCAEAEAAVKVLKPHLTVEKSPPSQSVPKGGTAKFKVKVTNDGEVTLDSITIRDELAPGCEKVSVTSLKPTESETVECETTNVQSPFTNKAKSCGTSEGVETCGESEAHVGIEGESSEQDFKPADTATVTVTGEGSKPPNGKLTFRLYKGGCEEANLIYTSPEEKVSSEGKASTESAKLLSLLLKEAKLPTSTAGTYNWQIAYGGDTNGNAAFTGLCGTEHFSVTNG
jgi:uncharacterized repeat protein (TIGR01451 family)